MLAATLVRLLLSPSGAIGRGTFAAGTGMLLATAIAADRAMQGWAGPGGLGSFGFLLVLVWSALCLSRKRLHDFGWSGFMIPLFLGLYLAVVCLGIAVINPAILLSWEQSVETFGLFSLPMVGWLMALAIIPGNGLRRSSGPAW